MLCITARYEEQTLRWPLPDGEARVGSAADNDLVLPFPGVSRRHAVIRVDDGHLTVKDVGSKNGLFVAGVRQTEVKLGPGERIQLGKALFGLDDEAAADVELAFRVERTPGAPRRDRGTSSGSAAEPEAAAAIRALRMAESARKFSGRRRALFMEECRKALLAETLSLCHVRLDGEIEIHGNCGAAPAADLLEDVVAHLPARSRKPHVLTRRATGRFLVVAGRGSDFLLAAIPYQPAPWVEDFVSFVAEKLLQASHAETPDAEPKEPADPKPELPAGMVIGSSEAMRRLVHQMTSTLWSGMDVLLLGETGTGKELLARFVHSSGPGSGGPFLAINCAAIPSELLEAELFGVVGRVATGVDPRPGMFVQADGGSIFLDEIGEMAERLQAKLLRVLQEREVLPLGAPKPRKIDVRVISASNRDLATLVSEGKFRADLYYRLRGLQFHLPPLRERKEDIPALVLEFLNRAADEYGKTILGLTRSALRLLEEHDWPGNVRELENEVRRAVLVCPSGASLQAEHFATVRWQIESRAATGPHRPTPPPQTAQAPHHAPAAHHAPAEAQAPNTGRASLRDQVDELERAEITRALRESGGNQSLAARMLGITRNGLTLKLKRLGLR